MVERGSKYGGNVYWHASILRVILIQFSTKAAFGFPILLALYLCSSPFLHTVFACYAHFSAIHFVVLSLCILPTVFLLACWPLCISLPVEDLP